MNLTLRSLCVATAARTRSPLVCVIAAAAALPVSAQTYTLITTDLQRITVRSPEFSGDGELRAEASSGDDVRVRSGELVALLADQPVPAAPPSASLAEPPVALLRTTDGRATFGRAIEAPSEDELAWQTMVGDRLVVPLEDVAEIVFDVARRGEVRRSADGGEGLVDDRVQLTNGDEVTGLLLAAASMVEIETDAGVQSFPLELVLAAQLANPPGKAAGPLVALADGSVVGARSIRTTDKGEFVLVDASGGGELAVDARSVLGVHWAPGESRGLASLGDGDRSAVAPLRWAMPVERSDRHGLGMADVVFAGPAAVDWPWPEGATRFGAAVTLPESTRPWGACDVVVLASTPTGLIELGSVEVDAHSPNAQLIADLRSVEAADSLRIEVRPGAHGPVRDEPVLISPLILIEP